MTTLTNGLVYRGLITEMLPPKAWQSLPRQEDFPICISLGIDGKVAPHEQQYLCPADVGRVLDINTEPFADMDQLESWYHQSLDGLSRTRILTEQTRERINTKKPWENNPSWKHHSAALMFNQIYIDSLTNLAVESGYMPNPPKDPHEDIWR